MTPTSQPLTLVFFSVIVKAKAVDRLFPGGRESFQATFTPSRSNDDLFLIATMGPEGVRSLLDRLSAAGLTPGLDIGVGDMAHGCVHACPELLFQCDGAFPFPTWTVELAETHDLQEPASSMAPPEQSGQGQAPDNTTRKPSAGGHTSTPWTRHAVRSGLVFWQGGDEDLDHTPPCGPQESSGGAKDAEGDQWAERLFLRLQAALRALLEVGATVDLDRLQMAIAQHERLLRVGMGLPISALKGECEAWTIVEPLLDAEETFEVAEVSFKEILDRAEVPLGERGLSNNAFDYLKLLLEAFGLEEFPN